MPTPPRKYPKRKVFIDCGDYIMRTITVEDATDRWAHWMEDTEASEMLNAPRGAMTKDTSSPTSRVLISAHASRSASSKRTAPCCSASCATTSISRPASFLVSMIIGEPDYRNSGVTNAVTVPFRDYFFGTLGMKVMLATALAHNKPIIHYLYATGWTLDKTLERHIKSHKDERMFDLCFFSQTFEAWQAWKKAKGYS